MPSKSQSVLIGAAVAAVLSLVQLFIASGGGQAGQYLSGLICCLVAIGGAGVAVWHYTSTYRLTIPAGTGAGLGAMATGGGYLIAYAVGEILQAVGVLPSDEEALAAAREQLVAQGTLSAEQIEQTLEISQMFTGVLGAVVSLILLAVVGAVVGAIAAAIFKKGEADVV